MHRTFFSLVVFFRSWNSIDKYNTGYNITNRLYQVFFMRIIWKRFVSGENKIIVQHSTWKRDSGNEFAYFELLRSQARCENSHHQIISMRRAYLRILLFFFSFYRHRKEAKSHIQKLSEKGRETRLRYVFLLIMKLSWISKKMTLGDKAKKKKFIIIKNNSDNVNSFMVVW